MGHWLEEAENSRKKSRHSSGSMRQRIARKKEAIGANYEKNKEHYDKFVGYLHHLIKRVNELPEEHREPFRKIAAASKKTKLNNHLNIFSSSRREEKYNFLAFIWLKPTHAKQIRVFYIYVSRETDYVNFEIKENYLTRKRISETGKSSGDESKKSAHSKDRVHVIFNFPVSKLNDAAARQIIDWLTFREQLQDLPFWVETPIEDKQFF
jgi:hypothetical protein